MEKIQYRDTIKRITTALFFAGLTIELFVVLAEKMRIPMESPGMIFRLTFVLFLCSMFGEKHNKQEIILLALFAVIGFISWRETGRNEILRMTIFVAAMKGKPLEKAMRYTLFLTTACSVLIILLSVSGIYGDFVMTENTSGRGVEVRYTLGFGHPNSLHCMVAMLMVFGLYLYAEKITRFGLAVLLALNVGFYILTKSESGFLITLFAVIVSYLFLRFPALRAKNLTYYAGEAMFAFGILFSLVAASFGFHVDWLRKFDARFLTGRMATLWDSSTGQGLMPSWSLFSAPECTRYFDMGFERLVYWYGVIPAVLIVALLFLLFRACRRQRDYAGFLFLLSCCLYTVLEAHLVSVFMLRNYVLFLIGLYAGSLFGKGKYEANA